MFKSLILVNDYTDHYYFLLLLLLLKFDSGLC